MLNPFEHPPVSIPDWQTAPSMKAKSVLVTSFTTLNITGAAATTTHGSLIGVAPILWSAGSGPADGQGVVSQAAWDPSSNVFHSSLVTPLTFPTRGFPNNNAIVPTVSNSTLGSSADEWMYRPTAMECRLTYLGTELNRSGRVTMGLAHPETYNGVPNTGVTSDSACNAINIAMGQYYNLATYAFAPQQVRNQMSRISQVRNQDGTEIVKWFPIGCPDYMPTISTAGTDESDMTTFSKSNIPVVLIMIEGDTTSAVSTTGNEWQLEVAVHWEIQAAGQFVTAIPVTPSPCDPIALAECLNVISATTTNSVNTGFGTRGVRSSGTVSGYASAWESAKYAASSLYTAGQTPLGNSVLRSLAGLAVRGVGSSMGQQTLRLMDA